MLAPDSALSLPARECGDKERKKCPALTTLPTSNAGSARLVAMYSAPFDAAAVKPMLPRSGPLSQKSKVE